MGSGILGYVYIHICVLSNSPIIHYRALKTRRLSFETPRTQLRFPLFAEGQEGLPACKTTYIKLGLEDYAMEKVLHSERNRLRSRLVTHS